MIFLVLYDNRGQCQRVAQVNSRRSASQYLSAGFVEVTRDEYNRCAELVPETTLSELPRIEQARQILTQIGGTQTRIRRPVRLNLEALERLESRQRDRLRLITQQRIDGELTDTQWYRRMVDAINQGNIAATSLANGSLDTLTAEDLVQIEQDNEIQLGYLNRYRRDYDNLSDAEKLNRSSLYAGAMTSRYWTAHTRALGLPPLPAMPGVRTSCGSNCKCNWNIIELPGNGNWDCQWRISAVESCEECLRRQEIFDPLEIRNGIVQPFNPNGIYK